MNLNPVLSGSRVPVSHYHIPGSCFLFLTSLSLSMKKGMIIKAYPPGLSRDEYRKSWTEGALYTNRTVYLKNHSYYHIVIIFSLVFRKQSLSPKKIRTLRMTALACTEDKVVLQLHDCILSRVEYTLNLYLYLGNHAVLKLALEE